MPYLRIQTNRSVEPEAGAVLMSRASSLLSAQLGKSESYIMVSIEDEAPMIFAGNPEPLAYLELKSIGLPDDLTPALAEALCTLLGEELGIPSDRIYIEFANAERHLWGWNGRTLGG